MYLLYPWDPDLTEVVYWSASHNMFISEQTEHIAFISKLKNKFMNLVSLSNLPFIKNK